MTRRQPTPVPADAVKTPPSLILPPPRGQYVSIDSELLARVRTELAFAEGKKYLAVPIDIADLKALLAAVGGEA